MNTHLKRYIRPSWKSATIALLLTAVGVILLASCGPSCDVNAYNDLVQSELQKWEHAMTQAGQLPPESLLGQIEVLKEIRKSMAGLQIPDCTFKAHAQLLTTMNYGIAEFVHIASQAPQETVDNDINNYQAGMDQYHQMLDQLNK